METTPCRHCGHQVAAKAFTPLCPSCGGSYPNGKMNPIAGIPKGFKIILYIMGGMFLLSIISSMVFR